MTEICDIVIDHPNSARCRACGAAWNPEDGGVSPCDTADDADRSASIWPSVVVGALAGLSALLLLIALALAGPMVVLVRHTLTIGG